MRFEPDSRHVRCYFLATTLFAAWKGSIYQPEFIIPINSNLCPYMRRLLITFPLLLLFYACVIFWFFYSILIFPAMSFGWIYFAIIGAAVMAAVIIVFAIYGMTIIFPKIAAFLYNYLGGPLIDAFIYFGQKTEDCILGRPDAPTFCGIVRQWVIDLHHQVCRPVVIGGEE